jgi:hypothetical protein
MAFITAAAIIGGAAIGAIASNKAAKTQAASADNATALQRDIYEQQRADQQPFYQGGVAAENRLLELLGIGGNAGAPGYGSANKPFTYSDMTADPGYNFRLEQGLKAMNQTAAARGGLISGSALKAGQNYGQAMGSQEYQNAFNRYQVNRSNILNPLQSLTGAGQTSANVMGQEAGTYGQSAGNNMIGAGNARASGYVGSANAITGGVGQYVNQMNQNSWLDILRGNGYGGQTFPMTTGGNTYGPEYQ